MKREALQAAARWYVQLNAGEVDDKVAEEWQRWLHQHPDHLWAWSHVESMQGALGQHREALPAGVADRAIGLASRRSSMRRSTLKGLFAAVIIGGATYSGLRHNPQILAQHRTDPGKQARFKLDDGSTLLMNTRTALDVAFSEHERRIRLLQGEVYIHTATDPFLAQGTSRPFIVETLHGSVRALGTRFVVRQSGTHTSVVVQESAVEIHPQLTDQKRIIRAGECTNFSSTEMHAPEKLSENASAWIEGFLVAENWPLDVFLQELGRYRPGYLGWAEEVARFRMSGTFPIKDTDLALTAMAKAVPVIITSHTRYWTRISVAPDK